MQCLDAGQAGEPQNMVFNFAERRALPEGWKE
jgi:hypothetical protein